MRFVCGEETIDVEVRDGDGEVEPMAPGTFVFRKGDRRETFHCVRDGDTVHLFWGGRAYRLEEETERSRASHRHEPRHQARTSTRVGCRSDSCQLHPQRLHPGHEGIADDGRQAVRVR